jgi:uncharacterized protein YpmB
MRKIVEKNKYIALIIMLMIIVVIMFCGQYYFTHNRSYKNKAIQKGEYLNDKAVQ